MIQAWIDIDGNVIAMGSVQRTLSEAKVINSAVEIVVNDAPDSLMKKMSTSGTWHKKGIQDGTDISHYTVMDDNPDYITVLRQQRFAEIDAKTGALIYGGFTYGGKTFSLSANAQINFLGLRSFTDWSYPKRISNIDDTDSYDIADEADKVALTSAARDAINGHVDSGRILKESIESATTVSSINAIVDSR